VFGVGVVRCQEIYKGKDGATNLNTNKQKYSFRRRIIVGVSFHRGEFS
jgi:hypothetical protein